ncbi:hypothetical protein BK666_23450 [Pseudomonas frederiksbergensis]|uniref:Uncharacterized protein n=1 Tax=Pseudomonas frederiksbergensis TaxID=104087 RepID=A0A423JWB4_9PSED|nr:hypothetical protein BK666_23450 [Pseudomonas frederiksbergensis]
MLLAAPVHGVLYVLKEMSDALEGNCSTVFTRALNSPASVESSHQNLNAPSDDTIYGTFLLSFSAIVDKVTLSQF